MADDAGQIADQGNLIPGGVDKLAAYLSCLTEANRLMVPVLFGLNRSPLEVKS